MKDYSQQELLDGNTGRVFIDEKEVDIIFDQHFIAYGTVNNSYNEATASVDEIEMKMKHSPFKELIQSIRNVLDDSLKAAADKRKN